MVDADAALDQLAGPGVERGTGPEDGQQERTVQPAHEPEIGSVLPEAPGSASHLAQTAGPSSSPRGDAASALPSWAAHTARRSGVDAALVAGLVRAAWRAAGAGQGTWLHEGALARPAVRAWRELDRPPLQRWEALLNGLASAREGGRLRGSLPKGWTWTPRGAVDLLRLGWARMLAENEADAPVHATTPPAARAPASMDIAGPVSTNPADPARWASEIAALRNKVGPTEAAVWLDPLELDGVDDGHVVVRCPGGIYTTWCAENYGPELVAAAGGPVRLVAAA
jgi:hypothetical protein